MKRLLQFALIVLLAFNFSCEGPEGPQGPQGDPGPQGERGPAGEDAQTAQVGDVVLNFEPNEEGTVYGAAVSLEELSLLESDMVLVYILTTLVPGENGGNDIPIWSPLPYRFVFDQGTVNYSYEFADVAAFFYIDTELNWAELEPGLRDALTKQQLFRLVVIPGEFFGEENLRSKSKEYLKNMSYKEVMKTLGLTEDNVRRVQLK